MSIKKQLEKRNKIIANKKSRHIEYFDVQKYLDFDLYSTYIFITPRNIGKTYSGFKLVYDVYKETGEYTVWMRSTEVELKEIIKDFGETKYDFWPEEWKLVGNSVIDNKTGNLVLKFVALSTAHNFASIKGVGCFGLIYDEFLPRSNRTQPSYNALTDFIKTLERDKLLTVILMANATTLDSEILNKMDIWKDIDKQTNLEKRVYYERIREWANPPDVGEVSTAYCWALNNEELTNYMFNSDFLNNDDNTVIPLTRLGDIKWVVAYRLNGNYLSVGIDSENRYIITPSIQDSNILIYNLTQLDTFTPQDNVINCYNVSSQLNYLFNALKIGNVVFTSYELRNDFYKFVLTYLPRKI